MTNFISLLINYYDWNKTDLKLVLKNENIWMNKDFIYFLCLKKYYERTLCCRWCDQHSITIIDLCNKKNKTEQSIRCEYQPYNFDDSYM